MFTNDWCYHGNNWSQISREVIQPMRTCITLWSSVSWLRFDLTWRTLVKQKLEFNLLSSWRSVSWRPSWLNFGETRPKYECTVVPTKWHLKYGYNSSNLVKIENCNFTQAMTLNCNEVQNLIHSSWAALTPKQSFQTLTVKKLILIQLLSTADISCVFCLRHHKFIYSKCAVFNFHHVECTFIWGEVYKHSWV